MPLPYGWDHEAIAAKLRTLGAEGVSNPKERYAIAMDSARADWRDAHGGAAMPKHLKKVGGVGARRNRTGGRNRAIGSSNEATIDAAREYASRQLEVKLRIDYLKKELRAHAKKAAKIMGPNGFDRMESRIIELDEVLRLIDRATTYAAAI